VTRVLHLAGAVLLALGGCRVGPTYVREPVPVPEAHRGDAQPPTPASFADRPWWEVFGDPALVRLLEIAVAENQDLRIAAARVAQARAQVAVPRSERFPRADLEAGLSRNRAGGETFGDHSIGTPLSWELDLWGRVASATEAAWARAESEEHLRRDVLRALVAEVAQAYVELRDLDLELAISEDTVKTRDTTLDLFTRKFEGERGNRLEVARARAERALAASAVPRVRQAIEQKENQIAVLLGRLPGPVDRGADLLARTPPQVPAGLPSALLERRPDVRAAEADVHAAVADIGVARADFFPRISLTGFLGLESRDLASIVSEDALTTSIGASLFGPLFDGGLRRGRLSAAHARFHEARALYVRSTQRAFQETADALAAVKHLRDTRVEDEQRVQALEEAVQLSLSRYDGGIGTYFEVLDTQRELFPARIALARTQRDQWIALVQLYRALGGGWNVAAPAVCR
jgi:multidrug efflux system outer membrane protein